MRKIKLTVIFLIFNTVLFLSANAQETVKVGGFTFTKVKDLQATSVKNQNKSGTCWDFSSTSFVESELIRMGKGEYDLSEMFTVRNAYAEKADQYVRWHGSISFSAGGEFHDVMNVIKRYGMVPQEVYPGLLLGDKYPVHNEMDAVLKSTLDQVIKDPNGKLAMIGDKDAPGGYDMVWKKVISDILDDYLGKIPEKFTYHGAEYTPQSFAKMTGFNPDDYVELTSFTHHPFYKKFVEEVPDNWAGEEVYNVPLADFANIINSSIMNGYTVAWGSDVSDDGFNFKKGVAIVPEKDWADMEKKEKDSIFNHPVKQKVITQEIRQQAFDDYMTTDDHGMHIVGVYTDQLGERYYKVKNSWGLKHSDFDGYFYASEAYILLGSTDIMVNKSAIPKDIARKLGIK